MMMALRACGSANADVTPTLSVDAIFTAAFQTLTAQQATQQALTPPTVAPSATLFPTLALLPTQPGNLLSSSPTSSFTGGVPGCNNSAFVRDITIPDGTTLDSGKSFVKTWLIQNTGSCAWNTNYKFTFISGDAMNGTSVAVPDSVPASQQVQISANLTAPTTAGNFKGYWRMQDDQGRYFGDSPWVAITVSGSATATSTPTGATSTASPSTNTPTPTSTHTQTPAPSDTPLPTETPTPK